MRHAFSPAQAILSAFVLNYFWAKAANRGIRGVASIYSRTPVRTANIWENFFLELPKNVFLIKFAGCLSKH